VVIKLKGIPELSSEQRMEPTPFFILILVFKGISGMIGRTFISENVLLGGKKTIVIILLEY